MADSIESLLAGRNISEPPEIAVIKQFVEAKFKITPQVAVNSQQIIISVKGSSLAGALQPHLSELKELCETTKRLVIRIK